MRPLERETEYYRRYSALIKGPRQKTHSSFGQIFSPKELYLYTSYNNIPTTFYKNRIGYKLPNANAKAQNIVVNTHNVVRRRQKKRPLYLMECLRHAKIQR